MNSLTHSTFDEKKTMRDDVYFLSSKKNIKEFRAKYNFFFFFFLEESVNGWSWKIHTVFIREDRFNKND